MCNAKVFLPVPGELVYMQQSFSDTALGNAFATIHTKIDGF
jgi:hypothetical protein